MRRLNKGARTLQLAAAFALAAAAGVPSPAAASQQSTRESAVRTAPVTLISSRIEIDGVLDEEAWRSAPPIGNLVQRQPDTGQPPSERTEVRLLQDGSYLYIGIVCYDSEPDKIIGTQMVRDATLGSDDRVEIVLDTFRDQRNAFYFATNPAGVLRDGLVFANGQMNEEWDGIWNVRTARSAQGWVAEFAIPFKTLSFPADRAIWGFNVARQIHRKQEEVRWSAARLDAQFFQVSEAGEITNLNDLSQGLGLDVRPFVGGRWTRFGTRDTLTGKPGLDMFYNFTPSLKLSATVNTDFGDTEVDARQINLSRFSLFFPEKRSFFLEDAGVFSFASTGVNPPPGIPAPGADVYPFFSRQIGLLRGEEVPLDVGVKLTGKVGRTDIGLLDVRTRDLPVVTDKNFVVARVRQNFLRQSYVGAIVTDGHPALSQTSRTVGADLRLGTSNFLGGNAALNAYAVRSINQGVSDRDWSWGVAAQYPNDLLNLQVILRDVQENFTPALGFVQRRNVRLFRAGAGYNPRPRSFLGLQQAFHDVYYTRFTRLDTGEVESWDIYANLIDWHFRSGDSLHGFFDFNPTYERLFTPFAISPGVVLPPGEYKFTRWRFNAMSASKRRFQAQATFAFGNYWSGQGEMVTTGITYKAPPWLIVSFNTNQTFARLPQGDFIARIFSINGSYAASPFVSVSNLIQYDNLSRNLGLQSRVRWTLQPGNDLFFVFSQGWAQDERGGYRFDAQDSKVSAKFQYATRF